MSDRYTHVTYPTARAIVLIDGEYVELTPEDPRWIEQSLDETERVFQRHLAASLVESKMKTPFNSPRDPSAAPYHLRNGVAERAEVDAFEADHRRRLGMMWPKEYEQRFPARQEGKTERHRFDAWVAGLVDPHGVSIMSERELSIAWRAWQAAQR